jgi:hypothetical protein
MCLRNVGSLSTVYTALYLSLGLRLWNFVLEACKGHVIVFGLRHGAYCRESETFQCDVFCCHVRSISCLS